MVFLAAQSRKWSRCPDRKKTFPPSSLGTLCKTHSSILFNRHTHTHRNSLTGHVSSEKKRNMRGESSHQQPSTFTHTLNQARGHIPALAREPQKPFFSMQVASQANIGLPSTQSAGISSLGVLVYELFHNSWQRTIK